MSQTWNTLLEPFKGQQLPSGARTDPTVTQREEEPMTLAKLWQYVPFLAAQGQLMALELCFRSRSQKGRLKVRRRRD